MNYIKVREMKIGEGIPKICVPIVGETEHEILLQAETAQKSSADLAEWRVDWFEEALDVEKVILLLKKVRQHLGALPLLFTFRTKAEGGEKEIANKQYQELLCAVARTKQADLIDVEVFRGEGVESLIRHIKKEQVAVVGSNHDFFQTEEKKVLVERMVMMQNLGVDIVKMAVMPQNESDVLALMEATLEMKEKYATVPIVTMSMSKMGMISRISGEVFGSAITFGTLGKASAPGQIEVGKLRSMLEVLHCDL